MQNIDLYFVLSKRAQLAAIAERLLGMSALSVYEGWPNADAVVARLNPVEVKPKPRIPDETTRSELLRVGQYVAGESFVFYQQLVRYRITDGAWLDEKTGLPIDMKVTHWIKAGLWIGPGRVPRLTVAIDNTKSVQ
jgi:hypothetical protein